MSEVRVLGIGIGLFAAVGVVTVAFGSWYTVDQGEVAVVTRNGKVVGVSEAGFHGKAPLVDSVTTLDIREQRTDFENMLIYTADQQPSATTWSVTWKAEPTAAESIYAQFGSVENMANRILGTRFPDRAKATFGGYTASSVVRDRSTLVAAVTKATQEAVAGTGLIVTGVQLINVDYSDAYEQSVEQRMQAEVEVAKLRENAEREKVQAEITVTQAEAKAAATKAAAEADAFAIKARGEAEADAIRARGAALRESPEVVALTTAERWNGALPQTMVPGSTVPFIGVR